MNIVIHFSNHLMAEAICQLLLQLRDANVVLSGKPPANGFTPDVLLVDITTLRQDLLTQYPDAKVLLMDTGIAREDLQALLLSYRIHGVLSPHKELNLFKKALTVVREGQIWIANGSVKAVLQDTGHSSQKGKISHILLGTRGRVQDACSGLEPFLPFQEDLLSFPLEVG
jgi:LuxR family transcriptional regulator, positive regulator of biofilm formation